MINVCYFDFTAVDLQERTDAEDHATLCMERVAFVFLNLVEGKDSRTQSPLG